MVRNFISKLYSLYTPSIFMSGGGMSGGYVIDRSLRSVAASSQYLTRTPSVAGNLTTWTWSSWIKITPGVTMYFINYYASSTSNNYCWYDGTTGKLVYQLDKGTAYAVATTAIYRDPSAWYHVVFSWDSSQANASDRMRIYVNGLLQTLTGTQAPQNSTSLINSTVLQTIGRRSVANDSYADGYQAEVHFINGQALTSSSFGETNPATGQWVAKKYAGTYSTNGFYLDFKDGTSTTTLGNDKSGNGNNWTLTNFTRSAGVNDCWVLDVPAGNGSASAVQPSGNYAVLNPLSGNTLQTLSGASLIASTVSATGSNVPCTIGINSGEYYFESITTSGAGGVLVGITSNPASLTSTSELIGYVNDGTKLVNGTTTAYAATWTLNDVIGVHVNLTVGEITFYKNGVSQGVASSGLSGTYYFVHRSARSSGTLTTHLNFGQRSFAYTPPAGSKTLCTANLPTPSIKKPSDHFNVQLSTGANIKTDSEALFVNELEWIKDRANANNHQLIDSVRGSNAVLQSNNTAVETTYTAPSGSSVGWVWRASDSAAVTNSDGSISSQVSANTLAGFSIVTYTGSGATNASVGHGLGIAPKIIILKRRDATGSWPMATSVIDGTWDFLYLEQTAAKGNATQPLPSSTVFNVQNSAGDNASGASIVAYCFAEIAGYSQFGSYTGNGSTNGSFVFAGFKPRLVMVKRTDTTSNWTILDSSRAGYNVDNDQIYPNLTNAEATTDLVDLISNGFKLRSTDASINANGGTYIYMAFAETPFQYANAR